MDGGFPRQYTGYPRAEEAPDEVANPAVELSLLMDLISATLAEAAQLECAPVKVSRRFAKCTDKETPFTRRC
jgi:hypothetical protein